MAREEFRAKPQTTRDHLFPQSQRWKNRLRKEAAEANKGPLERGSEEGIGKEHEGKGVEGGGGGGDGGRHRAGVAPGRENALVPPSLGFWGWRV